MAARRARIGVLYLTVAVACGDRNDNVPSRGIPTQQVVVAIAPDHVTLAPGAPQQFIATVTGAADTSVSWSLAEGAAAGAVSTSGAYVAPSVAGTYHLVATANADRTSSATATVTVTTQRGPPVLDVSIDPAAATLEPGAKAQFKAAVTGTAD